MTTNYTTLMLTLTDANVVLETSTRFHREDGALIKHLACLVCSTVIACCILEQQEQM